MRIITDICIAGSGIAGLSCARALARSGADVVLMERGFPGRGAGWAAAGMLSPLVEARLEEREVVEFGRHSLEFWPQFVESLREEGAESVGYRTEGTLVTGVERDHLAAIGHLFKEQQELGLPVERLTGYECRKLEPYLSPAVSEGLFFSRDHQVDNRLLLAALYSLCSERYNLRTFEGEGDVQLRQGQNGTWILSGHSTEVVAKRVVVATGASLSLLAEVAPELRKLIRPVKGQIARLDQSAIPLLHHVVRTPEVYFAPKLDGTLVVGASTEDMGFDASITLGPMFELFRAAWETVPAVYELPVIETSVGFRPASIDHAPLLGKTEYEGLYLASGYYRHGILFAPLAAELLAETILEDTVDERIKNFAPSRFHNYSNNATVER